MSKKGIIILLAVVTAALAGCGGLCAYCGERPLYAKTSGCIECIQERAAKARKGETA